MKEVPYHKFEPTAHTLLGVSCMLQPGEQDSPGLNISRKPTHLDWGNKGRSSFPRARDIVSPDGSWKYGEPVRSHNVDGAAGKAEKEREEQAASLCPHPSTRTTPSSRQGL